MAEGRILLTEDKDFGWLVYVSHANSAGVILIRFPGNARKDLAQAVEHLIAEHETALIGRFVALGPGQTRLSTRLLG
jgi:hypothetical protein